MGIESITNIKKLSKYIITPIFFIIGDISNGL
jgi:hypothetical protein